MNKKIGLNIGGRRYDVDAGKDFAVYLEKQMAKDFNIDGNNDLKLLLQAYVSKNYEIYMQEQKIVNILNNMDK